MKRNSTHISAFPLTFISIFSFTILFVSVTSTFAAHTADKHTSSMHSSGTLKPIDSVYINSGNPAFPFPQFQPYQNPSGSLGNLATKNAVGVSHAEMEQTLRDAYRIDMNQSSYTGTTLNGVKYIKYRSSPDCSEGDGYGLLSAASMADKKTFDGMWLWIHDNAMHNVVSYSTGQPAPAYLYSTLPGWQNNTGSNSATDGDVDIALALYTAYKQWGEFMGINDSKGKPISYKQDLIEFLKGMTDTLVFATNGLNYLSGDIGLDGYIKGGDSWQELTNWASNTANSGLPRIPEGRGPQQQYVDYMAPAYFHQFADFLSQENPSLYAWNIKQFQRCEASSDWIMGQLLPNARMIPSAGHVDLSSANVATFTQMNEGEDFRLSWRTILNYVWHGNPASSWDPAAHQLKSGTPNTYERDIGLRYGKFLWDNRGTPWNIACTEVPNAAYKYWGPPVLRWHYDVLGNPTGTFFLNWVPATGAPSAVTAQDFPLMAQLYRQCEIMWDADVPGDGYLTSIPHYYHGWFRLLGMLILSGNYQPPSAFKPAANMKVYMAVDKTFCFNGDSVTYTIDYRNYGSQDAQNVTITDTLHKDFIFLSATNGGVYSGAANTVTWTIGSVPGFKTATGAAPTKGQVQLKIKVGIPTQSQYRNRASISCSNGTGWISNEYPNHVTSVMERNYLDIAKRALVIKKSVSAPSPKAGTDVQFSIHFENSSDAGWINGGRPGVHFAYAIDANKTSGPSKVMRFRLFNDADESYIDYGNYRVSYFIYDSLRKCYQGTAGCALGWQVTPYVTEGLDKTYIKIFQENITPGQDSLGKWNQRIVVQFSDPTNPNRVINLAAPDVLLQQNFGNVGSHIHRGGGSPLRLIWDLHSDYNPPDPVWNDDWSWDAKAVDVEGGMYWPITSDWTDLDNPNVPITRWNAKACSEATHTVNNVLVEEWDGYTWRRVAGNGPLPGRDVSNVTIRDTIPAGLTFKSFTGANPFGIAPTINGSVITWTRPKMQVKDSGTIMFTATASSSCPLARKRVVNRAWITADKESPVADSAIVTLTCDSMKVITPTKSTLILQDPSLSQIIPSGSTARIDTTTFNVVVTDNDQNFNAKGRDTISVKVRNPSQGDSIIIKLVETGDSTGIFQSIPITVVSAAPSLRGPNQISATGGESIFITYVDPIDTTDISSAYLITLASFPVPAYGWILDKNGDGRADSAVVIYSKTLTSPPDSLRFNFPDQATFQTVKNGQGSIQVNGNVVTVSFAAPFAAATTAFSSGGQGSGLAFSTDGGTFRRFQFPVADSIGPIITAAQVVERVAQGIDTLYITFSEAVQPSTLTGQSLILIKNGNPIQVTIAAERPITPSNSRIIVAALNGSDPQPLAGDSLRILSTGPLRDQYGNPAHPLNPAVIITVKTIAPYIVNAYYVDRDAGGADGLVDTAFVRFNKKVKIAGLSFTADWGGGASALNIGGDTLSYVGTDSLMVALAMRTVFPYSGILRTSGTLMLTVQFNDFPGELRSAVAADSAAPVVDSAVYIFNGSESGGCDTLIVAFSEQISVSGVNPFVDSSKAAGARYSLSLSLLDIKNNVARFCSVAGATLPQNGDLIWINPGSNVADIALNGQNNPKNRMAALRVIRPTTFWKVYVSPNPFKPGSDAAIDTIVIAPLKKALALPQIDASMRIFDVFGNFIFKTQMPPKHHDNKGYFLTWNGRNQNNRLVGSGVYWALITITAQGENGVASVNKLKIGVKR